MMSGVILNSRFFIYDELLEIFHVFLMTLMLIEVHLFSPPPPQYHFCISKVEVIMIYVLKCFKFTMLMKKFFNIVPIDD